METTARLDRLRVLVVEDNPHMTLIVKTILRGFGIQEITEARTPEAAWTRLGAEPFDILVVDRQLGDEDGLDLTRRIRASKSGVNPYLPIIMLSAHTSRARIEEARDAGVTEFCCKPVTARDVFAKMAAIVDRPRAFVRTSVFFGPDRRRRMSDGFDGEERRQDAHAAAS
jgi:DNA-binding response OmpR family regulator